MQFSTDNLVVCLDSEVSTPSTNQSDIFVTKALSGAYLAWIESSRHGPFAEMCDLSLKESREFELPSTGFIAGLSSRIRITLSSDPHDPRIITPKAYEKDGSLRWWFPPSDEPDPTKMQAKIEKNAELLDEGLAAKDPSRLLWMRFDFPNQFLESDLREHELNPCKLYSSPFKNGSCFMQMVEQIYGLENLTFRSFHTLEGNVLYKGEFFARVNPAFVSPFSYYEIVVCYLPEDFDRDTFVWSLAALLSHELTVETENRRSSSTLQAAMQSERDTLLHGPRAVRSLLRHKQTELLDLAPTSSEYDILKQECIDLQKRIEYEKDKQCYYLPSLLTIE